VRWRHGGIPPDGRGHLRSGVRATGGSSYLATARDHAFTCLDPHLQTRLAHLGGPELGTGVLERVMRELNARTDIGGSRWSIAGLRDLLTLHTARLLHHPPGRRSNGRPTGPAPSHSACKSSTLDDATEWSRQNPAPWGPILTGAAGLRPRWSTPILKQSFQDGRCGQSGRQTHQCRRGVGCRSAPVLKTGLDLDCGLVGAPNPGRNRHGLINPH
jgi:hypothetical protein